jgi:hypothetical protein
MTSFHLCFKGNREAEIKFEIERVYKNREKNQRKTRPRPLLVSQQVVCAVTDGIFAQMASDI